jgi:Uma2 family endonuclease
MGNNTSRESLALRWAELCADPRWDGFAGKIELNGLGVIEMSPATTRHGIQQVAIGTALSNQLPNGTAMSESPILTADGVRVPDVAWASAEFMARHGDVTPLPQAPDICVEVRSPSNTDAEMAHKTRLFLEAGAVEVWIVSEAGERLVFDAQGQQARSRFAVHLESPSAKPGA